MNSSQFNEWKIERDAVTKTYDLEKFKDFVKKWQKFGMYDPRIPLPPDKVIEISMRKMVYHMTSSTEEEKKEAEQWLIEHGSSTNLT